MSSGDDCVIEGRCVSTKGYSSGTNYENNAACTISILRVEELSAEGFHTELDYDFVHLQGKDFSGESGPQSVMVFPGDEITWASGYLGNFLGWRICGRVDIGLHNCPKENCTADLHEGVLLDTSDSCAGKSASR